jgi:hypothetical protein
MPISIEFKPDIQRVLDRLIRERGVPVLAMLYKGNDSAESAWNFILAASWADKIGRADAIGVIIGVLSEELSADTKQIISRVTVLPTKDQFVRDITSFYQVASPGTEQWVTNISAGGIPIGVGYIFYSTPD